MKKCDTVLVLRGLCEKQVHKWSVHSIIVEFLTSDTCQQDQCPIFEREENIKKKMKWHISEKNCNHFKMWLAVHWRKCMSLEFSRDIAPGDITNIK